MSEETSNLPKSSLLQVPNPVQSSSPVNAPSTDIAPPPSANPQPRVRRSEISKPKGPFVKYVGLASQRIITTAHWGQRHPDLTGNQNHTWDMKNNFCIPVSEFSDGQLDYLLIDDLQTDGSHSFLEVDYNENGDLVQVAELKASDS